MVGLCSAPPGWSLLCCVGLVLCRLVNLCCVWLVSAPLRLGTVCSLRHTFCPVLATFGMFFTLCLMPDLTINTANSDTLCIIWYLVACIGGHRLCPIFFINANINIDKNYLHTSILETRSSSPAAKTHFGGEPVFVRYSFFMINYKRVRHAFSENAGWHPSILEHFEILAPLTHPPVNKSAYVAFSGPSILKPERLTKLIFTNPIASIARTSGITFKHILIFQMGWGHPWK